MRVFVNDKPVDIMPGMKIKHALIATGILKRKESPGKVYDEWGNEVGLDGALTEGSKIYVK